MPRNSSTIQPGRYEATLIGIRLWKPYNIEKGADFVLKLDEGQEVAWYAKAFDGPTGDGGMSLKAIMCIGSAEVGHGWAFC